MNCCKHKYFVIFRGDDTDFPGNQELVIEIDTTRDLTGCSAHFSFQGFVQDFAEIPADRKLRLVIPNSETGKFALGAADARLWLTNGQKIHTVENRIHVVVTNNVNEAYNNDDPQAITVTISGGGSGATVVLDDTVTETSSNGVKSSGIWSWVKSLLPKWLTSNYAEPATVKSVAAKSDEITRFTWTSEDPYLPDGWIDLANSPSAPQPYFFGGYWSCDKIGGCEVVIPAQGTEDDLTFTLVFADSTVEKVFSATTTRKRVLRTGDAATPQELTDAISTNNPAFVSAVQNTPTSRMPEDMPTDWGTFGTVGAALAALAAGLKWCKNILGSLASGYSTFAAWIASKLDRASLLTEYSATSAYSVGAIVYHDGNIYQCKTAIAGGGEAWNAEHWELRKLYDFFTESNSLLTGTIDARLPYPLYTVPSTGLLKDRAINTTSLASMTVPDNFTDLLVRASVASSLSVTMPEATTKYGDTFPGEAGEYLITITKTGAAEAYVRTIKLEEVA